VDLANAHNRRWEGIPQNLLPIPNSALNRKKEPAPLAEKASEEIVLTRGERGMVPARSEIKGRKKT